MAAAEALFAGLRGDVAGSSFQSHEPAALGKMVAHGTDAHAEHLETLANWLSGQPAVPAAFWNKAASLPSAAPTPSGGIEDQYSFLSALGATFYGLDAPTSGPAPPAGLQQTAQLAVPQNMPPALWDLQDALQPAANYDPSESPELADTISVAGPEIDSVLQRWQNDVLVRSLAAGAVQPGLPGLFTDRESQIPGAMGLTFEQGLAGLGSWGVTSSPLGSFSTAGQPSPSPSASSLETVGYQVPGNITPDQSSEQEMFSAFVAQSLRSLDASYGGVQQAAAEAPTRTSSRKRSLDDFKQSSLELINNDVAGKVPRGRRRVATFALDSSQTISFPKSIQLNVGRAATPDEAVSETQVAPSTAVSRKRSRTASLPDSSEALKRQLLLKGSSALFTAPIPASEPLGSPVTDYFSYAPTTNVAALFAQNPNLGFAMLGPLSAPAGASFSAPVGMDLFSSPVTVASPIPGFLNTDTVDIGATALLRSHLMRNYFLGSA